MNEPIRGQQGKPLLSIILPNRGHFEFAQETINNILEIQDNRFELIINDNSKPQEFDYAPYLQDKRVNVYIESEILSMNKNWWNGLSRARGKWVTFIGADDGVVTKNFPTFLDLLSGVNSKVLTTRQSVFSYSRDGHPPQIEIPVNRPTGDLRGISYFSFCAGLFPQLRNTFLPIPYNGTVVKLEVLTEILSTHSQIPGVAPDDFLGQYLSQYCEKGSFLDSLIFIQGTSERSNGYQFHKDIKTIYSSEFEKDSRGVMGDLTKIFGLYCLPALALEHFLLAREKISGRNHFVRKSFLNFWCSMTCLNRTHLHGYWFNRIFKFRYILVTLCASLIRKIWIIRYFQLKSPFSSTPLILPPDSTIRTASELLSGY